MGVKVNPLDPKSAMVAAVHPEQRSSFLEARKRLRDARIRQIDATENPQEMTVDVLDEEGKVVRTVRGFPFQVGQVTGTWEEYSSKPHGAYATGEGPAVDTTKTLSSVEDELDVTIREYLRIEGVAVSGKPGDKVAFVSEVDRPQHPPIKEGESHDEWFARTSETYTKNSDAAHAGRARRDSDGVRKSASDDSSDRRHSSATSTEIRGDAAPGVDCVTGADDAIPSGSDADTPNDARSAAAPADATASAGSTPAASERKP